MYSDGPLCFIKDGSGAYTVVVTAQSYQFDAGHPSYASLVDCVKTGDVDTFLELIDIGTSIENWAEGNFRFENGHLYYVEEQVCDTITKRMMNMILEGFDYKPMLNFLERLYQNPSYRAIHELYSFLEHRHLPITPDGYLLAYKAVTDEFMDKYSRTIDNSVGQKVTMPRFRVDDNCSVGCSAGLHVGAIEYVKSYGSAGDKVMICKIDPANVVSVPVDSDQQKVRCCEYEVVAEYNGDLLPQVVEEYDHEEEYEDYENEVDY